MSFNPGGGGGGSNSVALDPQSAAERAVGVVGMGYDLTADLRLSACKVGPEGSQLIELEEQSSGATRDLLVPGGVVVPAVSTSIKCDKGERARFRSDFVSFSQMATQINQDLSLAGKIPSGPFNAMFDYKGCWQKDASTTKSLAFDGWFISLYNIELAKTQITLSDQVKSEVPPYWDPHALAEFIDKYGTHIVLGVKMGGKDVIHIKQLQSSNLQPTEMQLLLKKLSDERFEEDTNGRVVPNQGDSARSSQDDRASLTDPYLAFISQSRPTIKSHSKNADLFSIQIRRGGINKGQRHSDWLSTVSQSPDVISMSFVPIASLLSGVKGSGFLSHAINLYLRFKPPIEELQQFLEFQLPRQWAPAYGELPLARRRKQPSPALRFSFMGPKLYVNTTKVDSGNRPVTGVRLYLEGKGCDHLAIHLQHLSTLPRTFQLMDDQSYEQVDERIERAYFEAVNWSIFSHVCTAPVEHRGARIDDSASIATKSWFEVKNIGMKKVLFLQLGFSMVSSSTIRRSEWDGPSTSSRKSGLMSMLMSTTFSTGLNKHEKPPKVDLNSAIYPGGPPSPAKAPKMTSFVDTKEMVRGPEDPPGYWVVTGAKLCVEGGKISIKVKYSLLTILSEDSFL